MAITIATFVNATAAPYVAENLNPKRQRIMRLLSKAYWCNAATTGTQDYVSSATRVKALITDAAAATIGMTKDQVEAARITAVFGSSGSGQIPALATMLDKIGPWLQLDEDTLDRMEMVIEYLGTGQT